MLDTGYVQKVQKGWQCPICKRILSPYMYECPCRGNGEVDKNKIDWTTQSSTTGVNGLSIKGHIPTIPTYYGEEGMEKKGDE